VSPGPFDQANRPSFDGWNMWAPADVAPRFGVRRDLSTRWDAPPSRPSRVARLRAWLASLFGRAANAVSPSGDD
jgi:hypothetical protein